ncbi:MAG TPA: hypothetical protein VMT37_01650 [Solirubrobacterales bacterium]|nr:hypothetical protein [Solirubrobacterales bacterium]
MNLIRRLTTVGSALALVPGQKVAQLQQPLRGVAVFKANRRLSGLSLSGGVKTARGIRVGSTAASARATYPRAVYQAPGAADPFAEGFLWIDSIERPILTLTVSPGTRKVETISVHAPNFCE